MQVLTIVNGSISLLLIPEDDSEIELLRKLVKQDCDLTEIRQQTIVLNKTFHEGILIGKKQSQSVKEGVKALKPEEDVTGEIVNRNKLPEVDKSKMST